MKTWSPVGFHLFYLTAVLLLLCCQGIALAQSVVADGEGPSRDTAIKEASRNAIEQAIGTLVSSNTQVSGGVLDMDKVVTASLGYVTSYEVLAEGKDPIDETYKVRIRAEVDEHMVKANINNDLYQKNVQTFMNNPRVMVIYSRRTPNAPSDDSPGAKTLVDCIQEKLRERHFRIFLQEELQRIRKNQTHDLNEKQALKLARSENADTLVLASMTAGAHKTEDNLMVVRATISLKAYDPTTGALYANVQNRGKGVSYADGYNLNDTLARIAIGTGGKAADALTQKIYERFAPTEDGLTVVTFNNISGSLQEKIERLIHKKGWKFRINSLEENFMELEIFGMLNPTEMGFELSDMFDHAGLPIKRSSLHGSRLTYTRK